MSSARASSWPRCRPSLHSSSSTRHEVCAGQLQLQRQPPLQLQQPRRPAITDGAAAALGAVAVLALVVLVAAALVVAVLVLVLALVVAVLVLVVAVVVLVVLVLAPAVP